jgi:hypothetical protein
VGPGINPTPPNVLALQQLGARQQAITPVKPTTVRGLPPQQPRKSAAAAPVLPAPETLGIGITPPPPDQLGIGVAAARP